MRVSVMRDKPMWCVGCAKYAVPALLISFIDEAQEDRPEPRAYCLSCAIAVHRHMSCHIESLASPEGAEPGPNEHRCS